MRRRSLLALILALSARAPSQRRLLAGRPYDEALRAAQPGKVGGATQRTELEADLQVGLHMQAVGAEVLRAQPVAVASPSTRWTCSRSDPRPSR